MIRIKKGRRIFVYFSSLLSLLLLFLYSKYPIHKSVDRERDVIYATVTDVIDGDTIVIDGEEYVRYIGIDTPEKGMPFYGEAKRRNRDLVLGKRVRLEICKVQQRDKYSRLLAYVYAGDIFVNAKLLEEGYAQLYTNPPCGIEMMKEFLRLQRRARSEGRGLWGLRENIPIQPEKARKHIGEVITVEGRVWKAVDSGKAIHLFMGRGNGNFRGVIFNDARDKFLIMGIDPLRDFYGKRVRIKGKVRFYRGPEIIIRSPSQIEITDR